MLAVLAVIFYAVLGDVMLVLQWAVLLGCAVVGCVVLGVLAALAVFSSAVLGDAMLAALHWAVSAELCRFALKLCYTTRC